MARWLSWLERRPVTAEVVGSIPSRVVCGSAEIGRQARLRILCPIGRVGSSPISRTQWREAEPGVLFQESVRRGGKLHAEIVKNKSVRA